MPADTLYSPPFVDNQVRSSIFNASEDAYKTLAENGYNLEDVHKIAVCYQAAALMVGNLLDNGYKVDHQIRSGSSVSEHSYVVMETGEEGEIVIDPTWQQFLPKTLKSDNMPKVLIGTRENVIRQALAYGVDEATTELWQAGGNKMTVEEQRRADLEAKMLADKAEEDGAWEKFMSAPR